MPGRFPHRVTTVAPAVFRCLVGGGASGVLEGSRGETITFTRATTATYINEAGAVVSVSSGAPVIARGGLLIEPAVTNLCLRSQEFNNAVWGVNAGTFTASADTWTAPDGTLTGDTFTDDAAGAVESRVQSINVTNGVKYTASFWAKTNPGNPMTDLRLRLNGSLSASANFTLTSTATRYSLTATAASTGVAGFILEQASAASVGAIDIWGAQLEASGVATSYVPTAAASVTRNAVTATVPTTRWPTTVGKLRCFVMLPSGHNTAISNVLSTISGNSGLNVRIDANAALTVRTGNGTAITSTTTGVLAWTAGVWYVLDVAWDNGSVVIYRDRALLTTGTSKNMPDQHGTAWIGSDESGAAQLSGYIGGLTVRR